MPVLSFKTKFFASLEASLKSPQGISADPDFTKLLFNSDSVGDMKVLQLSASLIRLSQKVTDFSTFPATTTTLEFRLSGQGITPVSSLNALEQAIEQGLASGTLTKLEILKGSKTLLTMGLDDEGYFVKIGDFSLALSGSLPLTFAQLGEIVLHLDRLETIDSLSAAQRNALFADLGEYSLNGISLDFDGKVLFAVNLSATEASLTLNGTTVTAQGSFPDTFGEIAETLWSLFNGVAIAPRAGFDEIAIDTVTFTNAADEVVGRLNGLTDGEPLSFKVDGKSVDELRVGTAGSDVLFADSEGESFMLAGMGGRDRLVGDGEADVLLGGGGRDRLEGRGGRDTLTGGDGDDVLLGGGARDILTGGKGDDTFVFRTGDGLGVITDFDLGSDVIKILPADRRSDLDFSVDGDDVLIGFSSIQIRVEDVTLAQINQADNFAF